MNNEQLTSVQIGLSFLLLLIPFALSIYFKLGINKQMIINVLRMTIQLLLMGVFLQYLYAWNNAWINLAWLLVMTLVAVYSAISDSNLRFKPMLVPVFWSFFAATLIVVVYLDQVVFQLKHVFDARYMVAFAGMILGNALRGNIVGINYFYQSIVKDEAHYLYTLAQGATLREAVLPYLTQAVILAIKPTLASMAIVGIVSLPGMMTGALLGGASPMAAIGYQIVMMTAMFSSSVLSVVLAIFLTGKKGFNHFGLLQTTIFAHQK